MRTRVRYRRGRQGRHGQQGHVGTMLAVSTAILMLAVYLFTLNPHVKSPAEPHDVNLNLAKAAATQAPDTGGSSADSPPLTQEAALTDVVDIAPLDVYAIQFGAFETLDSAKSEAARYVERGAAGYVMSDGTIYRVLGATYATQEDAQRVRDQLKDDENIDCLVYRAHADAVTLRVTATPAQIEALRAGFDTLRRECENLRAQAFELDKGITAPDMARQTIALMRTRVDGVRVKLETLSGGATGATGAAGATGAGGGVIDALVQRLTRLEAALGALYEMSGDKAMALSSKIKYNTIDMLLSQVNMVGELTGGVS